MRSSLFLILLFQISAQAQSPSPTPVDRLKKLEEDQRAFQKSAESDLAELEKHCRHSEGRMTITKGITSIGCRYGFTPLHFEDQWRREGRTFSSVSPQEFQDYCDASFITIAETKIYPGEICGLKHDGSTTTLSCFDMEGSKDVTETITSYCKKLRDRKITEEKPACGVNQPLNSKQSQAVQNATGALSRPEQKK